MKASCGRVDVIVQTRNAASGFVEDENISMLSQFVFHFDMIKLWSIQLKGVFLKHHIIFFYMKVFELIYPYMHTDIHVSTIPYDRSLFDG
jgi:hypothetical protein